MTDPELLQDNLARWLEPSGVQLDNDRIPLYRQAVVKMSGALQGRELPIVRAAHDQLDDDTRGWIATSMREADEGFVGEGKDALLVRLAGAAIVNALNSRADDDVTLVGLAVESARFLELTPAISDIHSIATSALKRNAEDVRARDAVRGAADAVGKLPPARKADPENGVVVSADDLAEDLGVHAKALRALGSRVDEIEEANAGLLAALEEETEILWWLLLGRDASGKKWSDHTPSDRAVVAAMELHERTLLVPGPPAAGYFLATILGDQAGTTAQIAELASAAAPMTDLPSGNDSLLPITSAIAAFRELDGSEPLWEELASTKFAVDTGRNVVLAKGSKQLYGELTMLGLLGE